MRDTVIKIITEAARHDPDIMFLSADFGAPALDEFRQDLPNQFIQTGISEQHMIDLAAGLALSGKKVYCYAMAPFMPARCFEQIKCSLASMNLPVTLIGVGVGLGYDHSSMTHIQVEDIACMRTINHLEILTPADNVMAAAITHLTIEKPAFRYLRLERRPDEQSYPRIYNEEEATKALKLGFGSVILRGKSFDDPFAIIFTSGGLVGTAIDAASQLSLEHGQTIQVIDVVRIKPFSTNNLVILTNFHNPIPTITVEEHTIAGGLGATLCEAVADRSSDNIPPLFWPIYRLGLHDGFELVNGDREQLRKHFCISKDDIVSAVKWWKK